jgi:hypothetical protein
MEPTTGKAGGGNRPGALKRYGPLIVIVAIVAVVAIVVAVSSGGSDNSSTSSTTAGGGNTAGATGGAPWETYSKSASGTNWGPHCDEKTGNVAIPWTYAPLCAKATTTNSGATADGVTGDSIKIVVYQGDPAKNPLQAATVKGAGADVSPATAREVYQGYVDGFSKYYNLYGRKIDLVFFPGTGGPSDPVTAKADADAIADLKPFAVLSGPNQTPVWSNELAARHVMCLGQCSLAVPQQTVIDNSPYLMGVGPTPEQAGLLTAKFVTTQLRGKKAVYGGTDVQGKTRVFGVTHYDTVDGQQKEAFATLRRALQRGNVKIAADLPFQLDLAKAQENARTMIAKLKAAGVTTVIYTGDPLTPKALTEEATAQNYFPEWVIGSNVLVDIALFGRTYDQQQWQHAFGLALTGARVNQDANEAYSLYQWFTGHKPENNTYGVILADLAQLVTGLHLTGPDLTPDTFQRAMWAGPVRGGTPMQPRTSWGHHGLWPGTDWGGSDDTGLIWWNPKAQGEDEVGKVGTGLYEYTAMGKRWTLDTIPSSDPGLFDPSKSITIFTSVPKQYQPPSYPSTAT